MGALYYFSATAPNSKVNYVCWIGHYFSFLVWKCDIIDYLEKGEILTGGYWYLIKFMKPNLYCKREESSFIRIMHSFTKLLKMFTVFTKFGSFRLSSVLEYTHL